MAIRQIWSALARWDARRKLQRDLREFTCGDCEKNAVCGRPPADDCVEKLEQIARDDGWRRRLGKTVADVRQL